MNCFLNLKTYGDGRIHIHVRMQYSVESPSYNEMTKKNREMQGRLIKAIYFLAKQEFSFPGQDGSVK
jgi:hypothetical protein